MAREIAAFDGEAARADGYQLALEQQILDFLDGRSDGAALFDALYGDTLDELLPPRLADLVRARPAA